MPKATIREEGYVARVALGIQGEDKYREFAEKRLSAKVRDAIDAALHATPQPSVLVELAEEFERRARSHQTASQVSSTYVEAARIVRQTILQLPSEGREEDRSHEIEKQQAELLREESARANAAEYKAQRYEEALREIASGMDGPDGMQPRTPLSSRAALRLARKALSDNEGGTDGA